MNGKLWYIKYAINNSDSFIEIATTRPETMLGDTAIAVNPKDKRYKKLIGQTAILPLVGRNIPIIADDMVDPEFGTGGVKMTRYHSWRLAWSLSCYSCPSFHFLYYPHWESTRFPGFCDGEWDLC